MENNNENNKGVVVCPWCQTEAKQIDTTKYHCPGCHRFFDTEEWEDEAYRSSSELKRHDVKITGIVSQNVYPLKEEKSVEEKNVYFNVDEDGKIKLTSQKAGTSEKTIAKIYSFDHEFWIVDCGCPEPIKITGEEKYNAIINWGDTIIFSEGIEFKYTSQGIKGIDPKTASNEDICIKVKNISSGKILNNVSFFAKSGNHKKPGFYGILGPSGCGKSSFIQRLIGLAPIDDGGEILINEKKLDDCKDQFLSICAYVPQQTTLHESLTVEQECYTYARLVLPNVSCLEASIKNVLHLVGLENDKEKEIRVLSGGQKKRLGIALELLREPQVLILDEPTSGLDPASETKIMNHLHTLAKQGKIVICTTHSMANIHLFSNVLILLRGKQVFYGSVDEALEHFKVDDALNDFNKITDSLKNLKSVETVKTAEEADSPIDPDVISEVSFDKHIQDVQETIKSTSFQHIYDQLSEKRLEALVKKFSAGSLKLADKLDGLLKDSSKTDSDLPRVNSANRFRQLWTYVNRNILYYCHNLSWIAQLAIQPILIALVIKLACAGKFFDNGGLSDTFFFCLMSMFWLGMNNSVRELVSQRAPGRCLERLEQVPMSVYLSSKWIWMAIICTIQTALFTQVLYLPILQLPVVEPQKYLLTFSWEIVGVFWGMSVIGYLIGLTVSAFFKTQTAAVAMLPIIVIPVILLSHPVIRHSSAEPNFTHVFLVAGLALLLEVLILLSVFIARRFKSAAVSLITGSFLTVAILYFGFANYYHLHESPKQDDKNNSGQGYSGLAEKLQTLSPCYMPLKLLKVENEYAQAKQDYSAAEKNLNKLNKEDEDYKSKKDQYEKDENRYRNNITSAKEKIDRIIPYYILGFLTYAILSVSLTTVFQYIREKEWEGR